MCQFASIVLTKKKAFWLPDSESHSEIIQQHKIHEGGGRGLNVVKVELVPQKGAAIKDGKPTGEWKCIFDQDQFPDWHDAAKDERRARHALAAKITNLTTLDARYSKIPASQLAKLRRRGCTVY